jgi:coenzyme F420-0:L-glutamate ligase/coenzyme F420-1:gamma-L-glutamate ligase
MTLTLQPIPNIPVIQPGDNLVDILYRCTLDIPLSFEKGDILVVAQKIVSKAEGRLVNLTQVTPGVEAEMLADKTQKDARLVELMLQESSCVLRSKPGTIIVEHKHGFVCANAGIDHSNVSGPWGNQEDWVLLLPENPDASAESLRMGLQQLTGFELGVIIIDSHGRAWRNGITGAAIGVSNVPGVVDMRGQPDMFGYQLRVTTIAAADELAAAASLVMGQAAEGTPAVHVRGFPYSLRASSLKELIRPKETDLFR